MAKTHSRPVIEYTVSTSAVTLTTIGFSQAQVDGALELVVTVGDGGDVRYLDNGTAPTATKGHILNTDESYRFRGGDFNDLQFIRESVDSVCTFQLDTYTA